MKYFAHINSKDVLTGIDVCTLSKDEYGSNQVINLEVEKELYDNFQTYGEGYYIFKNCEIVLNPEYPLTLFTTLKSIKLKEILDKANDFIENVATYKDIECTDNNIAKLNAYLTGFDAGYYKNVDWITKSDEVLNLKKEDIQEVLMGIAGVQSDVWTNQYIELVNQVNSSQSVEELEKINVEYIA
jgi:hypothetical protein